MEHLLVGLARVKECLWSTQDALKLITVGRIFDSLPDDPGLSIALRAENLGAFGECCAVL